MWNTVRTSAQKEQGYRTVLESGKNCPQCFAGICRVHSDQDHGQRAAVLSQKVQTGSTLDKMYENVKLQVERLQSDMDAVKEAEYQQARSRDRERERGRKRKKEVSDKSLSGLNADVIDIMSGHNRKKRKHKKEKSKKKKKHHRRHHKKKSSSSKKSISSSSSDHTDHEE